MFKITNVKIVPIHQLLLLVSLGQILTPDLRGQNSDAAPTISPTRSESIKFSPWDTGKEYTYNWVYNRKNVGKTHFKIVDLKKTGVKKSGKSAPQFEIQANLDYARDSSIIKSRRNIFYDSRGNVVRYHTRTNLNDVNGMKSYLEVQGWRDGKKLIIQATPNNLEDESVRSEIDISDGHVILAHAVETLAVLLPRIIKDNSIPDTTLFYPDFGKSYLVKFKRHKNEEITLGDNKKVKCQLFSFKSEFKQLTGQAWLDGDGKLVQYRQGSLQIQLETNS